MGDCNLSAPYRIQKECKGRACKDAKYRIISKKVFSFFLLVVVNSFPRIYHGPHYKIIKRLSFSWSVRIVWSCDPFVMCVDMVGSEMSVIEADHVTSAQDPIKDSIFVDQLMGNHELNSVYIRENVHKSNEVMKVRPCQVDLRDYREYFHVDKPRKDHPTVYRCQELFSLSRGWVASIKDENFIQDGNNSVNDSEEEERVDLLHHKCKRHYKAPQVVGDGRVSNIVLAEDVYFLLGPPSQQAVHAQHQQKYILFENGKYGLQFQASSL